MDRNSVFVDRNDFRYSGASRDPDDFACPLLGRGFRRDDVRGNRDDVRVRCRRSSSRGPLVSLILAFLLLAGCEKPFEPLAASDLVFSIYGHLDAAADTQWVRVMPIRESLETPPGTIDAVVTLEELETGETVVMSDSLFRYQPLFLEHGEIYAHNFSTTMPMVPGRNYRLTATRSDGASASATVLIPVFEFPTMELRNELARPFQREPTTQGTIRGTRHLAMVLGREDVPERCGWPFPTHQEYLPILRPALFEGDYHGVQLSWPSDSRPSYVPFPPVLPECPLGRKRVLAIASAEPWAYGATTQLRILTHPATIDNIEGRGVGFLAGVQTHVFPFGGCTPLAGRNFCAITFDPRSATLIGMVINGCTGGPLIPDPATTLPKPAQVRLLGPPDNGIRYDITDADGAFHFYGLEPGAAHSLRLEQLLNFPFQSQLLPVEIENVVVGEAAVDTITIVMPPRSGRFPQGCD